MSKISVDLACPTMTGGISLPSALSAVMREGVPYDWAGLARIRMIRDDLLGVDAPGEDHDELMEILTGLQAGLLYAAVSGLRLREGAPDRGLAELAPLCGTVGLVGPERGRGYGP